MTSEQNKFAPALSGFGNGGLYAAFVAATDSHQLPICTAYSDRETTHWNSHYVLYESGEFSESSGLRRH